MFPQSLQFACTHQVTTEIQLARKLKTVWIEKDTDARQTWTVDFVSNSLTQSYCYISVILSTEEFGG